MLDSVDEDRGTRVYSLVSLPADSLEILVECSLLDMTPSWPIWAPLWKFPTEEDRLAVERVVDDLMTGGKTTEFVVTTTGLLDEFDDVKSVLASEAGDVHHGVSWLGFGETPRGVPSPRLGLLVADRRALHLEVSMSVFHGPIVLLLLTNGLPQAKAQAMEWVRISADHRSFVLGSSGRPFVPWGFNYDHDDRARLIEDYWEASGRRSSATFREMKRTGRDRRPGPPAARQVHGSAAERPNERVLARFGRLLALAERLGLYLDLTGLGCYHKQDVPPGTTRSTERRWAVQARSGRRCRAVPPAAPRSSATT